MSIKKWAQEIVRILDAYIPDPRPSLVFHDHYTLLIAVLLSAQSTDKRVNEVTPQLFARASTPSAMILLDVAEIQQIIRPCGLSQKKASAIWRLSKQLIEKHKGKVPRSYIDLEELPGIGHKTAAVVLSQGFGVPAFPVDTHIHRCAKRWGLSKGKNVKETERDLKGLFSKRLWNRLHLQIILFARLHCPARGHDVKACPVCSQLAI